MRLSLILPVLVLWTAAAFAQLVVPYVAVQAQANFPQADFAEHRMDLADGGATNGYGGELTGGVLFEYLDVYVGARFAHFDAEGYVPIPRQRPEAAYTVRGDWTFRRIVVGARVHSCTTEPGMLSAIAGAGLSVGKSAVDGTGTAAHDTLGASEVSNSSLGVFGELGLSWGLGRYVDLLTLAKFDRFSSEFDNELWSGTSRVTWMTLSLGIVYRLKSGY